MAKNKTAAAAAPKTEAPTPAPTTGQEGGNRAPAVELTQEQLDTLSTLPTTSAKIRYLHSEGYTKSQIAKALDKRYQHVRNVLITPVANPSGQQGKATSAAQPKE